MIKLKLEELDIDAIALDADSKEGKLAEAGHKASYNILDKLRKEHGVDAGRALMSGFVAGACEYAWRHTRHGMDAKQAAATMATMAYGYFMQMEQQDKEENSFNYHDQRKDN